MTTHEKLNAMYDDVTKWFDIFTIDNNISVNLSILSGSRYINSVLEDNESRINSLEDIYEILSKQEGTPAMSKYGIHTVKDIHGDIIPHSEVNDIGRNNVYVSSLIHNIVLSYDAMLRTLITTDMYFDITHEYIKTIIKHEVGHCIDAEKSLVGITLADAMLWESNNNAETSKALNSDDMRNIQADIHNGIISEDSCREYTKLYHTLVPQEYRANNNVGLTWGDFWKFENMFIKLGVNSSIKPKISF